MRSGSGTLKILRKKFTWFEEGEATLLFDYCTRAPMMMIDLRSVLKIIFFNAPSLKNKWGFSCKL